MWKPTLPDSKTVALTAFPFGVLLAMLGGQGGVYVFNLDMAAMAVAGVAAAVAMRQGLPHDHAYALCCRPEAGKRAKALQSWLGRVRLRQRNVRGP